MVKRIRTEETYMMPATKESFAKFFLSKWAGDRSF